MSRNADARTVRKLRCAVYTRKSSEDGLEQEFNSLHAQREACEAYIASQRSEGWALVHDHYDDGGLLRSLALRGDIRPPRPILGGVKLVEFRV